MENVTGPHAKEVIRKYFRSTDKPTAGELLMLLHRHGLAVVPARRDRDTEALGPLIGKSHTASLIGHAR